MERSKLLIDTGNLIKRSRIEKGWSQKELSEKTGIVQPNISNIEKGKMNISINLLVKIFKVLEIKEVKLNVF